VPPQSNSPFANMPGAPGDLYDPTRAPGGVYGPAGAQEKGYGTNAEQATRAAQQVGQALSAVAPVMTFGASTPLQSLVGAASGGLGTKSAGGTNLQALRNAAIGAAIPPAAEYGGQALRKIVSAASPAEETASLVERRATPRTTMSATELEAAIKNRKPITTPFDYTEGARTTMNADKTMPKYGMAPEPVAPYQGGHTNGKVASVEELNRPGVNYVVSRSGAPIYHGKAFDPGSTPRGAAHVTALPNGEFRVNEGVLSPTMEKSLRAAVGMK